MQTDITGCLSAIHYCYSETFLKAAYDSTTRQKAAYTFTDCKKNPSCSMLCLYQLLATNSVSDPNESFSCYSLNRVLNLSEKAEPVSMYWLTMHILPFYRKGTHIHVSQSAEDSVMNGHSSTSDCACTLCFQPHNKLPSLPCWGWYPGPGGCPGRCCKLGFGGTGPGIPPCLAIGGNAGWAQRPLTLFAGGGGSCGAGGKPTCCWAGGSTRGPWKAVGCPGDAPELRAVPGPERETMSGELQMTTYQTCVKGALVLLNTFL